MALAALEHDEVLGEPLAIVVESLHFDRAAGAPAGGLEAVAVGNGAGSDVLDEAALGAIGGGMAIALFSYLGVEVAAVAAAKVKDPDRNIARSTVFGTLASAVVYLLSLVAVFGILSNAELQESTAPFSDAVNSMFGGTFWGKAMAVVVIE